MTAIDISEEGTAELQAFAEGLARDAGAMIRTAFCKKRSHYDRKTATDPVTETDRAVEEMLLGAIRDKFPGHSFIGEESASAAEWTTAPTWIVDPIDGTANCTFTSSSFPPVPCSYEVQEFLTVLAFSFCSPTFLKNCSTFAVVHKIPMCAVSIGFTVDREFMVGVIYNPILDEMFSASHLTPSTLNGRPIAVSDVSDLTSACVSTECGSDRSKVKNDFVLEQLTTMLQNRVQCVRMMGSCALNMAYLACGRSDIYYERGPYAWDMAAGVLIIRQAGGIVRGAGNGIDTPFDLTARSVLAFTPGMKTELVGLLSSK